MIYIPSPQLSPLFGLFLIFCCYSQGCNERPCTGIICSVSGGVVLRDGREEGQGGLKEPSQVLGMF